MSRLLEAVLAEAVAEARQMSVTVEQVWAWEPCQPDYPKDRVRELLAGRERWAALDFLRLDIPPEDRVWCICHAEVLPKPLLVELACRWAEHAPGHSDIPAAVEAVRIARAVLTGDATPNDAARAARDAAWAARDAAWAAAWAAAGDARDAARDAAWAARDAAWAAAWAARDAARDAARAARDAAWAAAWAAAGDAQWDSEREWQVAEAVRLLTGEADDE